STTTEASLAQPTCAHPPTTPTSRSASTAPESPSKPKVQPPATLSASARLQRAANGQRQSRPALEPSRSGGTGFGHPTLGGAKGIRTPDLLIANETRYQLRHSPKSGPV